jgi:hypothetical protein
MRRSKTTSDHGLTRRGFLKAGGSSVLGLTLPNLLVQKAEAAGGGEVHCIMLVLTGGPSQIDTWDPKPDAPSEIRGPFRPIATSVPGTFVSELFPRMARIAHKFSLIRSLHHPEATLHETGLQLIQTGRAFTSGLQHPHIGCALGHLKGRRGQMPAHVMLPGPIVSTGGNLPHGQSAGYLGPEHDPVALPSPGTPGEGLGVRAALSATERGEGANYGPTRFGKNCLQACRLIEQGVRFVTVNMFDTVFGVPTWDMHGTRPFSDFKHLAEDVAPNFDQAFSTLVDDLDERGLLRTTMVVAVGEFGRTPHINPHGGRDHHANVWTMIIGGGPIQGGRVIGASDESGFAPRSRPVTAAEMAATIYHGLGVDLKHRLLGPGRQPLAVVEEGVQPVWELF